MDLDLAVKRACDRLERMSKEEFESLLINYGANLTPLNTVYYTVVRTHSHTDRQQLWKVMTRPIPDLEIAKGWKSFCESQEKNKNHKFFIVTEIED